MTWVKICGITNLEDALIAVEAGADAVGFVFHEKSPRKVDVETARAIVAELPKRVEKVGVFVEQGAEEIRGIVQGAGFTAVQVHGVAPGTDPFNDLKSFRQSAGTGNLIVGVLADELRDGFAACERVKKEVFAVLIDSGSGSIRGGTGKTFDWEEKQRMVQEIGSILPVIVAGGLTPPNVREAIGLFRPFGVDVASGVEARPGKKDSDKVKAFVRAVRAADQKAG
jgi:phosphoribosylanthranilate isomerase